MTNAHIVRNSKNVVVINSKNEQFKAIVVKLFADRDMAILKIVMIVLRLFRPFLMGYASHLRE